jgi:hypothetical protein
MQSEDSCTAAVCGCRKSGRSLFCRRKRRISRGPNTRAALSRSSAAHGRVPDAPAAAQRRLPQPAAKSGRRTPQTQRHGPRRPVPSPCRPSVHRKTRKSFPLFSISLVIPQPSLRDSPNICSNIIIIITESLVDATTMLPCELDAPSVYRCGIAQLTVREYMVANHIT